MRITEAQRSESTKRLVEFMVGMNLYEEALRFAASCKAQSSSANPETRRCLESVLTALEALRERLRKDNSEQLSSIVIGLAMEKAASGK